MNVTATIPILLILSIVLVSGCTQTIGTIDFNVRKSTTVIECPFNLTPIVHKIGTDYICLKVPEVVSRNTTPVICPTELPLIVQSKGQEFISGAAEYNYTDEIPMDYFVECQKGKEIGENPRHWYCGSSYTLYYDYNSLDKTDRIESKLRVYPTIELDENQDFVGMACESENITE